MPKLCTLPTTPPPPDLAGRRHSTAAFLRELYGGAGEGYMAVWTLPSKGTHWYRCDDADGIAAHAVRASETEDVYFGVGLQPHPLGASSRGQQDTVCGIPGLWVDVDIQGPAHSSLNLPTTIEEALGLVNRFPLRPSVIVMSGHGLQAYWLFREFWRLVSDEERNTARVLSDGLQQAIRSYASERGWLIDHTADLSRVLRLPGTLNRKREPVEVRVIDSYPERRYNPSDFDDFIVRVPQEHQSSASSGDFPTAQIDPILDGCGWLRHCRDDAATLPEPEWYAMLSIVGRCGNGAELVHEYSRAHPKYTPQETAAKAQHSITAAGPRTCSHICHSLNGSACSHCANQGRVRSPIVLGLRRLDEEVEAAGVREAQQFVDGRLPRVREDPAAAFGEDFLETARLLERNDVAWAKLRDALKKIPGVEWSRFKKV